MESLTNRKHGYLLLVLVALLLFIAALRLQHLVTFVEWPDEIRSMWRTQGDLQNLLIRTPNDWPPLYGMLIWGWVRIAGPALEGSRFLSVLFSLLGAAFVYRAALLLYPRHRGSSAEARTAALLATTVYASMGYFIFESVDVRAYGMLLMLGALAFWLMLRWLNRPSWRRALMLAVVFAVLFYTSYTSPVFIAYLTLFIVILKPRLFLRWILIGVGVALLSLPIIPRFLENAPGRIGNAMPQPPLPFAQAILKVYQDFGGSVWFVALFGLAGLVLLWQAVRARQERRWIILLFLWILFPVATYFAIHNQEFLKPRYQWFVGLGLALLIGYAALQLPRLAQWGAIGAFVLLPAIPVDFFTYRLAITTSPPFRETFAWLSKNMRPKDVLIIDPNCTCGEPYAWDYFVPQYFPTGFLPIVRNPGTHSRVWYLSTTGWPRDEALVSAVEKGRKASIFYGPWFFLVRLYEGPPVWDGIRFADKFRFHGGEIEGNDIIMAKDESFQVKLWWSAPKPIDLDYSISVAVLDSDGQLIAQADGPPSGDDTPSQTSAWQTDVYYEDVRALRLPPDVEDGDYRLVVAVYQWWDGVRLKPEANDHWSRTGEGDTYLVLTRIRVVS